MGVVSSLENLSDAQKQELISSLSAIVVGSAGAEVSAESLSAVATASGNELSGVWASVFASAVSKAGDVNKFCLAPVAGGGGGGGGGDGGAAAEEEKVEEVEGEVEEAPPAVDMFGGDDGGDY